MYSSPLHLPIYALSGLGADARAFDFLELDREIHVLDWLEPEKDESLVTYAKRMSDKIPVDQPFILLGLSFGGIVAGEIHRQARAEKLLLISSVPNASHIPKLFKFLGKIRGDLLIGRWATRPPMWLATYFFGTKNKTLLRAILKDTSPHFLKWAIRQVCTWKNTINPHKFAAIHGNQDRILPAPLTREVEIVDGGGHFMVVDEADSVSKWINRQVSEN